MKNKLLAIFAIFSIFLLAGCSQKTTYEEMEEEYGNGSMTMEELNAEAQRLMEENGLTEEDFEEESSSGDSSSGSTPNTMKMCQGTSEMGTYLIYLTGDTGYEKVTAENGGVAHTWLTGTQSCALLEPSEVPRQCVDLSPSEYAQHYMSMKQTTEEPFLTILNLRCSTVDYDESVFEYE